MNSARVTRLEWRLRVMMAERKIKTVTELKRRLDNIGVTISTAQLGRMIDVFPSRLNRDVFAGLLTVLQCEPADLIRVTPGEGGVDATAPRLTVDAGAGPDRPSTISERRARRTPVGPDNRDVTGPKVTAFPRPEERKP